MKLANWKRMVLGALLALSVAGGSLAPVVAGHASAEMAEYIFCSVKGTGGHIKCEEVEL